MTCSTSLRLVLAGLVAVAGLALAVPAAAQHGAGNQLDCPIQSKVGDQIVCHYTIRNRDFFGDTIEFQSAFADFFEGGAGPFRVPAAGNLALPDPLPAGVTCAGAAPNWEFPCELVGLDTALILDVPYTPGAGDPLLVSAQGKSTYRDTCDVQPLACDSDLINILEAPAATSLFEPAIRVTKTGPEVAKVGDEIEYTVTLFNESSPGTPALDCSYSDDVTGDSGPIIPDGAAVNYSYVVQPGDLPSITNTVTVTCAIDGFTNEVEAEDSWTVDTFDPAIRVTKTGPDLAKVGDEIEYTVTLFNESSPNTPALDCSYSDDVTGDSGPIIPDGAAVNYSYVVQPGDLPSITNTVTVTCAINGFTNEVEAEDSWTVDTFDPAIRVTKTGPDLAKVGDEIEYTVTLFNESSPNTPALDCSYSDDVTGDSGPIIPDGAAVNYSYVVQPGDLPEVTNTVTVTCAIAGFTNEVEAEDSWTVDLIDPQLSMDKTCAPPVITTGDDITWTISVNNDGDAALDCLVNDPTAGYVDEPVNLGPFSSSDLIASRATVPADEPLLSNTATVECTLTGGALPNVLRAEASADCEVKPPEDAICRTPGFWGTHAGTEKKNSSDLTQIVIDAAGGSLSVCGETITNTDLADTQSAVEGICVSIQGEQRLQLARQLTALALNCVISGGNADCTGTQQNTLFADANAACIANAGNLSSYIEEVDCFNNGGEWDEFEGCVFETEDNCHNRSLRDSDVFDGVDKLPGPAGSSNKCNAATSNNVNIFQ